MFVELSCTCEAVFQMESEEHEDAIWLMANRFIAAHLECGYMNPVKEDTPEKTKRYNITLDKREKKEKED